MRCKVIIDRKGEQDLFFDRHVQKIEFVLCCTTERIIFMFTGCLAKQRQIIDIFKACPDETAKYQKIIELGRRQTVLDPRYKIPDNIVKGCQSVMHLRAFLQEDAIIFAAASDALISAGLAAILIAVYSGETPQVVLQCPPAYLETLGIGASLTPSRANGLYSIHLRMKQDALKFLAAKQP